jgi:HEAT repeat protein
MTSRKKTLRDQLRRRSKELLLADLSAADPETQRKAAFEAGRRGMREAAESLRALLDSSEPDVRSAAAEALGKIGDRTAGDELARLLADEKQPVFVRDTCAYALARLAYAPALDVLISALRDPNETVRNCASAAVSVIVNSRGFRPALRPSHSGG